MRYFEAVIEPAKCAAIAYGLGDCAGDEFAAFCWTAFAAGEVVAAAGGALAAGDTATAGLVAGDPAALGEPAGEAWPAAAGAGETAGTVAAAGAVFFSSLPRLLPPILRWA